MRFMFVKRADLPVNQPAELPEPVIAQILADVVKPARGVTWVGQAWCTVLSFTLRNSSAATAL